MKRKSHKQIKPPERHSDEILRREVAAALEDDSMMVKIDDVDSKLVELTKLHHDRSGTYGTDYLQIGPSLKAMFPEGLSLETARDFTRFALLLQAHGKLMRYAVRFHRGGHADSLNDLSVYAQILRHVDEREE